MIDWHDRFWSKVHPEALSGCWLWHACIQANGYGQFGVNGRVVSAHRHAFQLTRGEIRKGMDVCHRCDVRACVNPDHLFLGTRAENMRDATSKGRVLRGERQPNAKLSERSVQEIRRRSVLGEPQRSIAAEFGISQKTVSKIARAQRWSHVGGPVVRRSGRVEAVDAQTGQVVR